MPSLRTCVKALPFMVLALWLLACVSLALSFSSADGALASATMKSASAASLRSDRGGGAAWASSGIVVPAPLSRPPGPPGVRARPKAAREVTPTPAPSPSPPPPDARVEVEELKAQVRALQQAIVRLQTVAGGGQAPPPALVEDVRAPPKPAPRRRPAYKNSKVDTKTMTFAEGRAFYEPIFARYARWHGSVTSTGNLDGSRVISVQPVAQLTNRMRVVLGALLVGIITDRLLLVQGFNSGFDAGLMDLFAPILSVEHGIPVGPSYVLSIEDWESMFCGGGTGEVLDNPAVSFVVDGLHFFVADLYVQSSFRAAYTDVFGRWDGRIFAHAYAYFFPPTPSIARDVVMYKRAVFDGHFMVGLHIRSGGDFQDPMTAADWGAFRTCAEALVPPERRGDVRYFAAVDTVAARERTTAVFANSSADVLFYKDFLVSNTVEGVQRAFTDQLLVAACDLLVVTPASSYSEAATLLAEGRPAYYANLSHAQWWYGPAPPSRWAGGACRTPLYAQLENQNVMRHLPLVSCASGMDELALAELLG